MLKKAGLPQDLRLRHDFHFVEELTGRQTNVVGRIIGLDRIDPNPYQPRYEIGDITELAASIREKGIIEPLVVRQVGDRYQLISGERRYRAALEVGLREVPCVEREASDREALEIALIENLQRKDLTAFEEGDGFKVLCESYGYTHEEVAAKIGKARNSVTETIRLSDIPERMRALCRRADITSKSILLQIAKCESPPEMEAMIEEIGRQGMTRDNIRNFRKTKQRQPQALTYKFKSEDGQFFCAIRYRQDGASKAEVLDRLKDVVAKFEAEIRADREKAHSGADHGDHR